MYMQSFWTKSSIHAILLGHKVCRASQQTRDLTTDILYTVSLIVSFPNRMFINRRCIATCLLTDAVFHQVCLI